MYFEVTPLLVQTDILVTTKKNNNRCHQTHFPGSEYIDNVASWAQGRTQELMQGVFILFLPPSTSLTSSFLPSFHLPFPLSSPAYYLFHSFPPVLPLDKLPQRGQSHWWQCFWVFWSAWFFTVDRSKFISKLDETSTEGVLTPHHAPVRRPCPDLIGKARIALSSYLARRTRSPLPVVRQEKRVSKKRSRKGRGGERRQSGHKRLGYVCPWNGAALRLCCLATCLPGPYGLYPTL